MSAGSGWRAQILKTYQTSIVLLRHRAVALFFLSGTNERTNESSFTFHGGRISISSPCQAHNRLVLQRSSETAPWQERGEKQADGGLTPTYPDVGKKWSKRQNVAMSTQTHVLTTSTRLQVLLVLTLRNPILNSHRHDDAWQSVLF